MYSKSTKAIVREFQNSRGLPATGVFDRITWRALVEAGYRFGDRILYLHRPYLRGEDVGELQARLGSIGFDPGVVDGIFGERTMLALRDFQDNVALPPDGICGPSTVDELKRVFGRSPEHVHGVRERELIRSRTKPISDSLIVVCSPHELAGVAELLSLRIRQAGLRANTLHSPEQSELATRSNTLQGDICIYLDFSTGGLQLAYYSGFSYTSPGARRVAEVIADSIMAKAGNFPLTMKGMTLPILRETKMLTVAVQLDPPAAWVTAAPLLIDGIVDALIKFLEDPQL